MRKVKRQADDLYSPAQQGGAELAATSSFTLATIMWRSSIRAEPGRMRQPEHDLQCVHEGALQKLCRLMLQQTVRSTFGDVLMREHIQENTDRGPIWSCLNMLEEIRNAHGS